jgi:hypothetical protein
MCRITRNGEAPLCQTPAGTHFQETTLTSTTRTGIEFHSLKKKNKRHEKTG